MKSFVSPVFVFVFVAGWIVAGENGNSQSDRFPFGLTVTTFFSSCCAGGFFLYPQVLSPLHRLKPEIIH